MSDLEYDGTPIINPSELPTRGWDRKQLFKMWACTYAPEHGYVWADNFEDAFEEWVEYLDTVCQGCFVTVGEAELKEAAEDLGVEWDDQWPEWGDPKFIEVVEHAEADLTAIGHTTLKSGTHIRSDEWGGGEVSDEEEAEVWQVCADAYAEEYGDDDYPEPPSRIEKYLRRRRKSMKFDLDGVPAQSRLPRWARLPRRT